MAFFAHPHRVRRLHIVSTWICVLAVLPFSEAVHHMNLPRVHWVNKRDDSRPLVITNQCSETIFPGILTDAGTGPGTGGFKLSSGESNNLTVSGDWSGRVWGRTNCSFSSTSVSSSKGARGHCETGDCSGALSCSGTGELPVNLAEFTLETGSGMTWYDLSLVDGYNLPMGIISLHEQSGNSTIADVPPNLTNPVCIATASELSPQGSTEDEMLGTNESFPLPLDQAVSNDFVQRWCPWDLQLNPPQKPGDGVYPYPDDNIARESFSPCYSACAKYDDDKYCCRGDYDSASSCSPSLYSRSAKKVCPDGYSYAFDDQTSTFTIPSGGGFEIVFCPKGRSTNILASFGDQLRALAQGQPVSKLLLKELQNATLVAEANTLSGGPRRCTAANIWAVIGAWIVLGVFGGFL